VYLSSRTAFSALTLLVGRQEGHPACKTEWWSAGVVICLERGADLHTAQLMPLPLTVSCFSEIQICFTFLVPAHLGSPGQRAVKRVCVCVCPVVRRVCCRSHSRRQRRHDGIMRHRCGASHRLPILRSANHSHLRCQARFPQSVL